jgi:hypothetical protein
MNNDIEITVSGQESLRADLGQLILESPSRRLLLTFHPSEDEIIADTYLKDRGGEKQPGETTALYRKVDELILDFVNERQRVVRHRFSTLNPRLVEWGSTKGEEIFHWDFVYSSANDKNNVLRQYFFTAEKIYHPKQAKNNDY